MGGPGDRSSLVPVEKELLLGAPGGRTCPIDSLPAALLQSVVQRVVADLGGSGELRRVGMVPLACATWRTAFEDERSSSEPLEIRIREGRGLHESELERDVRALGVRRVLTLVLERDSVTALGASLVQAPVVAEAASGSTPAGPLLLRPGQPVCQQASPVPGEGNLYPWTHQIRTLSLCRIPVEFGDPRHAARAFASLTSLSFQLPPSREEEEAFPSWLSHLPSLIHLSIEAGDDGGPPFDDTDVLPVPLLPLTLQSLRLRNLRLRALPEGAIGSLSHLTELRILGLWRLSALPESLGDLPWLRLLQVHSCAALRSLPQGLTRLGCLSSLDVHGCPGLPSTLPRLGPCLRSILRSFQFSAYQGFLRLPSFPEDLTSCAKLEVLTLSSKSMSRIPDSLAHLRTLRRLRLEMERLVALPDVFDSLASLSELILFSEALEELPSSLATQSATATRLRTLGLFCPSLRRLPPGFGSSGSLRTLTLSGCYDSFGCQLEALPSSFGYLSKLQVLCIAARGLRDLPVEAAPHLLALTELRIQYWDGDPHVLEAFLGRLPALEALSLVCARGRVSQLPASLRRLGGSLQRLQIEHSTLASEERSPIRREDGAVVLWARHCMNLGAAHQWEPTEPGDTLPAGIFDGLAALTSLHINCSLIGSLPRSLTALSSLKRLRLSNGHLLSPLTDLTDPTGDSGDQGSLELLGCLRSLEDLRLEGLGLIEELPHSLSALTGLTSLHVQQMRKLHAVRIWPSWGRLKKLRLLSCPLLRCYGDSLAALSQLESLTVDCTFLDLPQTASLGALQQLTELSVVRACRGGAHRTRLPDSLGLLPSLKSIAASTSCLGELPASVSLLTGLTSLDVDTGPDPDEALQRLMYKSGLLFVPPMEGLRRLPLAQRRRLNARRESLCSLNWLHTAWLPESLQCFARSLKRLTLDQYTGETLPSSLQELQALTVLWLKNCPRLRELPIELASLPHLKVLDLERCPEVEVITGAEEGFPSLQLFSVSSCQGLQRRRQNPFSARCSIRVFGLDSAA